MFLPLPQEPRAVGGLIRIGRLAGWILLLLFVEPVPGHAEEKIIYPRNVAATETTAPEHSTGSNATLLLLALAAAGAGGWLLWRQKRSAQGLLSREARKLAITETRSLGNRQYLVVADYDGRKFLLGVCPGRIDLLSNLDGTNPPRTP